MQSWSVEDNDRIWIPSMITLPFGTIYPTNVDGEMKWASAEMVDIPEEEQKILEVPSAVGAFVENILGKILVDRLKNIQKWQHRQTLHGLNKRIK